MIIRFLGCVKGRARGSARVLVCAAVMIVSVLWTTHVCASAEVPDESVHRMSVRTRLGAASLRIFWVDVKGKILSEIKAERATWVWKRTEGRITGTALRLSLKPLQVLTPVNVRAEGAEILSTENGYTIDLMSSHASFTGKFKDENGKTLERALVFVVKVEEPFFFAHPACKKLDLNYTIKSGNIPSQQFFTGVYCSGDDENAQFTLFKSQETKWRIARLRAPAAQEESHSVTQESTEKTAENPKELSPVITADLQDNTGNKSTVELSHRVVSWTRIGPPILSASLGISFLDYNEKGLRKPFSETGSTIKLGYQRPFLFKNVDIAFSAFYTAFVLETNRPGFEARYLGINARLSYTFKSIPDPWRFSILGGWYFTTMFVTANRFGYENLQGPQLFPLLRRIFLEHYSAHVYVKYAPITIGAEVLSPLENREIAAGFGVSRRLGERFSVSAAFDYGNLAFGVGKKTFESTSSSISLGASLSF